ncbi:hypothetical protein HY630_02925 [Candidatus Uhrbacteria bacterium]|nr:hypothetical protein [Candidatus Uhrbacteria bacterium]
MIYPFGEEIAMILLGVRGIKICRALHASEHFNVLSCPGAIETLCADAWQTVVTVAGLIGKEGQRMGLDVSHQVRGGSVWMGFAGREVTFTKGAGDSWTIELMEPGFASHRQDDLEQVFEAMRREARDLFMPAFECGLEELLGNAHATP